MKNKFLLAFLFLVQIAFGQTEKLIRVPGTKCSMTPPNGFIAATTFSGFQHTELGVSIMINELPAPYKELVAGFTAEALATRGMKLIRKESIDLNNSKATIFYVTQSANGTDYLKQMLVFGDPKVTVMVNAIYTEYAKEIEPTIKEALLSTVYNAAHDENPLEAASFTVDVKGTDFKITKYMSGSLLYTTDGKIPTEKPTLIVANSIAKVPIENQKNYAVARLKKLPGGEQSIIKEITNVSIDNMNGYQIIANGKTKENKPELIYQVMLFNDNGDYYLFVGQTKEEFDKYLGTFKNIAKTFKRK